MRRIFAAAIAAAALLTISGASAAEALFSNKIKGTGNKIIENRKSAMNFNEIEIAGPIDLTISERRTGDILVRADENIIRLVRMEVRDGKFRASLSYSDAIEGNLRVEIEMPYNQRIDEISASAASTVTVEPLLVAEEIELKAVGASRLRAAIRASSVEVELGGASSADLTIKGEEVDISAWGASSLNNLAINAVECEIYATGASKITSSVIASKCEGEAAGASKITLSGEANISEFSIIGASKLNAANLVTNTCKVEASGASSASVNCTNTLNAKSSGASKISYRGNCHLIGGSESVTKQE